MSGASGETFEHSFSEVSLCTHALHAAQGRGYMSTVHPQILKKGGRAGVSKIFEQRSTSACKNSILKK